MSIKKEAYGFGAVLAKHLGVAAAYLGEQSAKASVKLTDLETKAAAKAAAEAAAREEATAARDAAGVSSEATEAPKATDDISDLVTGLMRKARAEGAEIADDLREEVRRVLTRLQGTVADKQAQKAAEGEPVNTEVIVPPAAEPTDLSAKAEIIPPAPKPEAPQSDEAFDGRDSTRS